MSNRPPLSPAFVEREEDLPVDELDLVYIGRDFPRYVRFHGQPMTDHIRLWAESGDRYCIQKVDGRFEVYDMDTLKNTITGVTIGLPKFVSEDFNAAIMWALMSV
jgi:hypothetical protein